MNDKYLIWSNEHRAWWRPNSRGYTMLAKNAGVYTFKEAQGISWRGRDGWIEDGKAPDEIMVPLAGIPELHRPFVNEKGSNNG